MTGQKRTVFPAFLVLILAVFGLGNAFAQNSDPSVVEIRVGLHPDMTRVVVDISEPVNFNVFTLPDPYRVVVDLPDVPWKVHERAMPSEVGYVKNLRSGRFKPGVWRLVVEVKRPVSVAKTFTLPPLKAGGPHRMVFDLKPVSRDQFLKTARKDTPPPPEPSPPVDVAKVKPKAEPAPPPKPAAKPDKPDPAPRRPSIKPVVVIDPGHGGQDPGALGKSGTREKDITLIFSRELRNHLNRTGRYRVHLTRSRDIYIPLRQRVAIARDRGADLFISVHADSVRSSKTRGFSVYTLSETASDKEAALLAEKENKSDLIAGVDLGSESPDVTNILIDLAQRETMNQSARFAERLVRQLSAATSTLRKTHRFAGFAVLKAPDVPSILLELGFLSNRTDERNLQSRAHRAKMQGAIEKAINSYFQQIQQAENF